MLADGLPFFIVYMDMLSCQPRKKVFEGFCLFQTAAYRRIYLTVLFFL